MASRIWAAAGGAAGMQRPAAVRLRCHHPVKERAVGAVAQVRGLAGRRCGPASHLGGWQPPVSAARFLPAGNICAIRPALESAVRSVEESRLSGFPAWARFRRVVPLRAAAGVAARVAVAVIGGFLAACSPTVASGNGVHDQQPGSSALPCAVSFHGGYVYYSLVHAKKVSFPGGWMPAIVRRVSLATGQISTVAGAVSGQAGNGFPALKSLIGPVCGIAANRQGDVFLSDSAIAGYKAGVYGRSRVRLMAASRGARYGQNMLAGHLYTIAGGWNEGYAGDGGPAVRALLDFPSGLAVDRSGSVIIADGVGYGGRIRVVAARNETRYGTAMTAGDIYTIGGGQNPARPAKGSGIPAVRASLGFGEPFDSGLPFTDNGVAVDAQGNILVADTGDGELRVIAASTGTFYGRSMRAGYIYAIAGGGPDQPPVNGDLARHAKFFKMGPITLDQAGNVIMSAGGVRVLAARSGYFYGTRMRARHLYLIAGGGTSQASGIPAAAAVASPLGIAVDGEGNIVFSTASSQAAGYKFFAIKVIAARSGTFYGIRMRKGDVYTIPGATSWPWPAYAPSARPSQLEDVMSGYVLANVSWAIRRNTRRGSTGQPRYEAWPSQIILSRPSRRA